jgi:hypothetical protein
MNYKQKLTSLLCEVEEVKRDIEELRFGCKLRLPKSVSHPNQIFTLEKIQKCHPDADSKYIIYYCNPSSYRFVDKFNDEII